MPRRRPWHETTPLHLMDSNPMDEEPEPREPDEDDYAEARRRLLEDFDEDNLLEAHVERLAGEIARGEA